jgi:DNA-binding HxlR family transcriptional regulator
MQAPYQQQVERADDGLAAVTRRPDARPFLHAVPHEEQDPASASDREMIEATNAALTLFGAKWKVDVLYLLASGVRRRHALHDHLLVSKRVLTEVLRGLERDGLVHRHVRDAAPIRVDYTLTPLGRSLTAPLFALYEWAEAHMERVHVARDEHDERSEATALEDRPERRFGAAS